MSWLTNIVRPKLRNLIQKPKDVADNLWIKCTGCGQMIFHRDLSENMHVCPHCTHHLRLDAIERLALTFDEGRYTIIKTPDVPADPLKFRDLKKYSDRHKTATQKTGRKDSVIVANGKLGGLGTTIAVFDFAFMGGSMGTAAGEAIVSAAHHAIKHRQPLVIFVASGGARMQEGILSLMQMPRSIIAVEQLKDKGLPFIVVHTDPTTGGVSASFAMVGDIHIAEPGSTIGFAGKRVIEETIREKLPEDFQTAEYLYTHGMVDMVVPRKNLRDTLIRTLSFMRRPTKKAA